MKYLVITPRILFPADSGGKIRTARILERMSRENDVTVVCYRSSDDSVESVEKMRECCTRLEIVDWVEVESFSPRFYPRLLANLFSRYPYNVAKYCTAKMRQAVRRLMLENRYDILICDFLQVALNVLDVDFSPRILFEHNVEAVIRRRQFREAGNPAAKVFLFWDWIRTHRFERRAGRIFDHSIMVSEKDCRTMADEYGVYETSAIPLGVDVDYFQAGTPLGEEGHLVFTGAYDWQPNQGAVQWFVEEVLPRIRREVPVKFWIVGRKPTGAILKLGREHADVEVTGRVEDIRPYVDRAAVYVVPLHVGGGTRIKIFEAMAMRKAIVSTRLGAEGLPVSGGKDIVFADSPEDFARETVRLLRDPAERRRLGDAGRALVVENYSWEKAAAAFTEICEGVFRKGLRHKTVEGKGANGTRRRIEHAS